MRLRWYLMYALEIYVQSVVDKKDTKTRVDNKKSGHQVAAGISDVAVEKWGAMYVSKDGPRYALHARQLRLLDLFHGLCILHCLQLHVTTLLGRLETGFDDSDVQNGLFGRDGVHGLVSSVNGAREALVNGRVVSVCSGQPDAINQRAHRQEADKLRVRNTHVSLVKSAFPTPFAFQTVPESSGFSYVEPSVLAFPPARRNASCGSRPCLTYAPCIPRTWNRRAGESGEKRDALVVMISGDGDPA